MKPRVTIVDYGVGNMFSVRGAMEHCNATVEMSSSADVIENAERLLLPGVGAFSQSMNDMRSHNLVEPVRRFVEKGRPLMGICLGMQMLFEASEEFGLHDGLAFIPGVVSAIPPQGTDGKPHRISHVGWEEMAPPDDQDWKGTLLDGVKSRSSVYFSHSFRAVLSEPSCLIAACDYDGHMIPAMVGLENVLGCQFHPEKSGETGIRILKNFLSHK